MGCGAEFLSWLSATGKLPRGGRMLDIGESCLLDGEAAQFKEVVRKNGGAMRDAKLDPLMKDYAWRSRLRGHDRIQTLFLAEIIELTDVQYVCFEVGSARKTTKALYPQVHLFDLNVHSLSPEKRATFDLIVNFGTTEHLMNQYNAFKVMHEAAKPGALMFHQLPSTGYINHGYFCYNALMFQELAQANGYDIVDLWLAGPNHMENVLANAKLFPGVMDATKLRNDVEGFKNTPVPASNINVLMRKGAEAPFRVGLEVKTAAADLDKSAAYTSEYIDMPHLRECERMEAKLAQATGDLAWMKTSKFWKARDAFVRVKRGLGALAGRGAAK